MANRISLPMEENDYQIYEVTRPDNSKEYYRRFKGDTEFFPYGGGFSKVAFEAKSIEPIDNIPTKRTKGYAFIEDGKMMEAYCNVKDRWNGWAKPLIHEKHIKELCEYLNIAWEGDEDPDEWFIWEEKEDCHPVLHIKYGKRTEMEDERIHHTFIDGENYYDLGGLGWTWDFLNEEDAVKKQRRELAWELQDELDI